MLYHTLGKPGDEEEDDEVSGLIDSAKALVTYFKQANLQSLLPKTLKASVETRWNSLHTMLDSIHSQYAQVRAVLEERGEQHRLDDLSPESLGEMVSFLERFREATKAMEASKTPTLHLTAVWLGRLRTHLQPDPTDSPTLSLLKRKSLPILNEKLELHLLHKMAVFLHPKLKSLKLLGDQDVATVHGHARRLVQGKNNCWFLLLKMF